MATALKEVYTEAFFQKLIECWEKVLPNLNKNDFLEHIYSPNWKKLELKERISQIANAMKKVLPNNFKDAAPILVSLTKQLGKDVPNGGFEYLFLPEYVEKNGINKYDLSLKAMEEITKFVSCEFAIRPFILMKEDKTMEQMLQWSLHEHASVRRLASEGCRPRLPWSFALPKFKKDPASILPILENLKNDESLYVRKSVANNLNDISKDHPQLAMKIAKKWYGSSENTNWIVKHAMRTLLKAGEEQIMPLFGYSNPKIIGVSNMEVYTPKVQFGSALQFAFNLTNSSAQVALVRIEYGIYFLKNNGTVARKVFKISEKKIPENSQITVEKKHIIKPISTRKYYAGEQFLSVIINGLETHRTPFLLNMD